MKLGSRSFTFLTMLWLALSSGLWAQLPSANTERVLVTPSLVADTASIEAGKSFTVGVRLQMAPGWHVYWQFGGDSGAPPQITWELPPGFKAGAIQWPIPTQHMSEGDQLTYVYENDVLLLVEITAPASLPAGEVTLKAGLRWLVCEQICVPGSGDVALTLPTGPTQPANAELFNQWRAQLPQTSSPPFQVAWERAANALKVQVTGLAQSVKAEFFPLPPSPEIKPGHPTLSAIAEDGARTFTVPIEEGGAADLAWQGVIATTQEDGSRRGWLVAAPAITTPQAAPQTSAAPIATTTLFAALWAALLGGLILNLMPCVLPVIALKIFGFVRQAGEEPRRVFHLGLAFAAGVLVFFLALAGLAIALRASGHGFFWGMQFSDPRLLIGLISLVVLFAIAMFGAFEITLGGSAENALGTLSRREGLGGAFVHGLFTTLLGTSCTAPFVGPVLGFAVTQPPLAIVAIFATMAIGMSLPYVLLTWQPAWMRFLPKPGAWMERFKQLMGFVLLAVAIWLLGVVGSTRGAAAMTATAWFLVLLALGGWIYGAGHRRWWALLLGILVATLGGIFFLPDAMKKATAGPKVETANSVGIVWEAFSRERLEAARKAGPVFIDFTADWCPNCKANEKFVINTEVVAAAFKEKNVRTLVADWTDFDPEITAMIKSFQRIGVPVYVLYPGGDREPQVLPEILTQATLLRYLAEIPG